MLHAVNARKARLGAFRGAGLRVPLEDVVTSTVFGPLRFMSVPDRDVAIRCLADALAVPLIADATGLDVRFWPRLPLVGGLRSHHSEPDLMIVDDRGVLAVVEIKWGAALSEHELAAQWSALSPADRRRAAHVLLVLEPSSYRAAVARDVELLQTRGVDGWRCLLRGWDALLALNPIVARAAAADPVLAWAEAVTDFLRREARRAMHGWDALGLEAVAAWSWSFRQRWFRRLEELERHEGWWNDV